MFTTSGRKPTRYQLEHDGGFDVPAVLAGTLQLTDRSANVQVLDPGAANREVRMPASNRENVPFEIIHAGAANNLELRDSTGAAIAGVTTVLTPGQSATVVRVGGVWRHLGIRAITL